MRLTDSHCHLAMLEGAGEALTRAREAGVAGFVVPGTRLDDSRAAVALAGRESDVWAAVGFHPHDAKHFDAGAVDQIRSLASRDRVVAIGEIGLDYHYLHSPREIQQKVFARQLAIAVERNLPAIIHNRESTDDLIEILSSDAARGCRGILHSFTESYEVASRLIDRGFFISFSGILTFRSAEPLREVAKKLPHEMVLIETDTPYLAPVPHRGKTNEPALVGRVAETLADLWSIPAEDVATITTSNFERAFSVTIF
jgi:TatD DNase family protein